MIDELFNAISKIDFLKTFKHFPINPYTGYVYKGFNRYLSYY